MTRMKLELEIMRMLNQGIGGASILANDAEQRATIEQLKVRLDLVGADFTTNMVYQGQLERRNADLMQQITRLREALTGLYALVKGECPSLLNEDSGGDARLDMEIEQALMEHP